MRRPVICTKSSLTDSEEDLFDAAREKLGICLTKKKRKGGRHSAITGIRPSWLTNIPLRRICRSRRRQRLQDTHILHVRAPAPSTPIHHKHRTDQNLFNHPPPRSSTISREFDAKQCLTATSFAP